MHWLILLVLLGIGLSSAPVDASPPDNRRFPKRRWEGCEPPDDMKPRPQFRCGQEVADDSTGVPRRVKIERLSAAPVKGGFWLYTYHMTDGTFAHADSLKE
jgi:hypothetical protein